MSYAPTVHGPDTGGLDGWCFGEITRSNTDGRRVVEKGVPAKFFVYYEIDERTSRSTSWNSRSTGTRRSPVHGCSSSKLEQIHMHVHGPLSCFHLSHLYRSRRDTCHSAQSWVPSLYMCMRMRCARAGGVLSVTVCLVIGDGLIWRQ